MHKWFAVEPHLIIANSSTVYPEWRVCMFVRLSVCRKNVRNTNENGDSRAFFDRAPENHEHVSNAKLSCWPPT